MESSRRRNVVAARNHPHCGALGVENGPVRTEYAQPVGFGSGCLPFEQTGKGGSGFYADRHRLVSGSTADKERVGVGAIGVVQTTGAHIAYSCEIMSGDDKISDYSTQSNVRVTAFFHPL